MENIATSARTVAHIARPRKVTIVSCAICGRVAIGPRGASRDEGGVRLRRGAEPVADGVAPKLLRVAPVRDGAVLDLVFQRDHIAPAQRLDRRAAAPPAPADPAAISSCEKCSFTCDSNQQFFTHMFHNHDYRNPIQLRMKSSKCLRCKTEYHSGHRLYSHLSNRQTKNKCFSHYMELEPMPIDELEAIVANCPTMDALAFPPPPVKCA